MADSIYLDNAATSFPKPNGVIEAISRYSTTLGASPGRGSYAASRESARLVHQCRVRLCELVGSPSPEHVVFGLNTTDALNLAIHGLVGHRLRTEPQRPVHLVTTQMDHNSVLRPFNALVEQWGADRIAWTCVEADAETGLVDSRDVAEAICGDTLLVACVHASNVSGVVQPISAVGDVCRIAGVPLLVDAAQSLGHVPVDVEAMGIDLLAFPGHKGLLGPLGTGGLIIRPGLEDRMDTVRQGGTGSRSEEDVHPMEMPDRFEAGSHNTLGIVGLGEGVGFLLERGIDALRAHEVELIEAMLRLVPDLEASGYRLLGPREPEHRVAVFALDHESISADAIADAIEASHGVQARAGLHCAPRAHAAHGTAASGAIRLSFGPFNTLEHVSLACDALREAARTLTAGGEAGGAKAISQVS